MSRLQELDLKVLFAENLRYPNDYAEERLSGSEGDGSLVLLTEFEGTILYILPSKVRTYRYPS